MVCRRQAVLGRVRFANFGRTVLLLPTQTDRKRRRRRSCNLCKLWERCFRAVEAPQLRLVRAENRLHGVQKIEPRIGAKTDRSDHVRPRLFPHRTCGVIRWRHEELLLHTHNLPQRTSAGPDSMAGSSCGPCAKAGRGLRSTCTPIFTVIAFSLMLTYVWVLYHPGRGPGLAQRMGWQSWEVVKVPSKLPSHPSSTETHTEGTSHKPDTSVDWWNVTKPEEKFDSSSLPLDVWSPLLPHDTGCTYIFVYISPLYSKLSRNSIRNRCVTVPLQSIPCTRTMRP